MIELISIVNNVDYVKELEKKVWDNDEYKYYFISDWLDTGDSFGNVGWFKDGFIIKKKKKNVGFIKWSVDRNHDMIDDVCILLDVEYLNSGVGYKACKLFLENIFNKRNIRKIGFSCVEENIRARKIYNLIKKCGGQMVGIFKKDYKLRDGKYYNRLSYEILKEDYDKCPLKKD